MRDVLKGEGAKRGYAGAGGVLLLVYAMLLTRGLEDVKADMDDPNNTLTGQFGHCTQEVCRRDTFTSQGAFYTHLVSNV